MPLNYDKLMSMTFEPTRQTYARRDTMLYALGVGVGALDPCDPQELKYVYEKNLVALPTLAVTLAAGAMRLADPVVRHQLPHAPARRADARDAQAAAGGRHGRQRGEDRRDLRQGREQGRDHVHDAPVVRGVERRSARHDGQRRLPARRRRLRRQERRRAETAAGADRPAAGSADEDACDAQPGAHLSPGRRLQPVAHRSRRCAQRRLRSADPARARRVRHGRAAP